MSLFASEPERVRAAEELFGGESTATLYPAPPRLVAKYDTFRFLNSSIHE
jgi:hypothetical protein